MKQEKKKKQLKEQNSKENKYSASSIHWYKKKLEVPTSTKKVNKFKDYKIAATYKVITYAKFTYNYSDSGMTSNSRFRRLVGIFALTFMGPVEANGLGGIVNLSSSPSNI